MRKAVAAAALAVLAACSADKPKPTPLENYTPSISARQCSGSFRRNLSAMSRP